MNEEIVFHDLECGAYRADLELWRELADEYGDPVVDLGAGTGRVSLDLAAAGHEVIAVDIDGVLLAELSRRAELLPVRTVTADVREVRLDTEVPLVVVPMQTVQLLGGKAGRDALFAAMRACLAPGGVFAAAIAEDVEPYSADEMVAYETVEHRGVRYESDPFAIEEVGDAYILHHARVVQEPNGRRRAAHRQTRLDRLDADTLEREGAEHGFSVLPRRFVDQTDEHVGSAVVMLGA
ncbi:MAG: class I SAM-dependent methyltransferase [Solirubrobacteraceae bacterium]